MGRRAAALVLIVAAAVAVNGCGYALAGRGSFLPTDIRTIGIPDLINRTTYFDVEQILTAKIRNEFIGRGKYRVVPTTEGADAALNAEIATHQRTQPHTALEGIFVRDDLRQAASLAAPAAGELTAKAIWTPDLRLAALLVQHAQRVGRARRGQLPHLVVVGMEGERDEGLEAARVVLERPRTQHG